MTGYAIRFAEDAMAVAKDDYLRSLESEGRVYAALGGVLERYRLLICPTFAVPALDAGEDYTTSAPAVNGVEQRDLYDVMMTIPFNLCSRCPVMSVPSGRARNGVPTGVQIVGRTYDDVSVFRAAAALERIQPWLDAPERRPALG